jgi:hypothetical protein
MPLNDVVTVLGLLGMLAVGIFLFLASRLPPDQGDGMI